MATKRRKRSKKGKTKRIQGTEVARLEEVLARQKGRVAITEERIKEAKRRVKA